MVFTPKEVRILYNCFFIASCALELILIDSLLLQIDFFAKDELVTILPNFSLPTDDSHCVCIMVRQSPCQFTSIRFLKLPIFCLF